jgi:hypothetical protein
VGSERHQYQRLRSLKYENEFVALQGGFAVVKGERKASRKVERHASLEVV